MAGVQGRRTWIVCIVACLLALSASPAAALTTSKPYAMVITPGNTTDETVAGVEASGETVQVTATFTNETSTQQIGSANLFWPVGFNVLTSTAVPDPYPLTTSAGSASRADKCSYQGVSAGACVQLRNLSLPPGQSFSVGMWVTTPACDVGSAFPWYAEVKQANNYSGSPGNDLYYDAGHSQPDTTLDGACSLSFTGEPANAKTSTAITQSPYNATGNALTVQVLGNGTPPQPLTTSTAPVTMAIGTDPSGATLAGDTLESANGTTGTASFNALTIGLPGIGYTLSATSGTLGSAASNSFDIQDAATSCPAGVNCNVHDGSTHNFANIVANASTGSGLLVESVFPTTGEKTICGNYTPSDPNMYESAYTPDPGAADRGETITTTFGPIAIKGSVQQYMKAQQICFGDAQPFVTAAGVLTATKVTLPDGKLGYVGLLQTCSGSTIGPCHNRQADAAVADPAGGYDITLVANVPVGWADDPLHM